MIEPGPDRRRRAERLRQVQSRRGPALGDGRELVQEHARVRHGRRDLFRLRQAPGAQHRRSRPRSRQFATARAPAAFNDADTIEVTRRIERESGSTYRVNGREVRARDVQLLFADASTGARSPALVRQGQIGEIIAAKPQARRRILEEAAGVAGPAFAPPRGRAAAQGRRGQSPASRGRAQADRRQIDSLNRQARQADALSQSRRRTSAATRRWSRLIAWRERERAVRARPQRKLEADVREVAERTRAQARGGAAAGDRRAELPPLREKRRAPAPRCIASSLARDALAGEEKRAGERVAELERRIAQFARDLAARRGADRGRGAMSMARLTEEDETLAAARREVGRRQARGRRAARAPRAAARRAPRRRSAEAQAASPTSTPGAPRSARRLARGDAPPRPLRERMRRRSSANAPHRRQRRRGRRGAARREPRRSRRSARRSAAAEGAALAAEAAHARRARPRRAARAARRSRARARSGSRPKSAR